MVKPIGGIAVVVDAQAGFIAAMVWRHDAKRNLIGSTRHGEREARQQCYDRQKISGPHRATLPLGVFVSFTQYIGSPLTNVARNLRVSV